MNIDSVTSINQVVSKKVTIAPLVTFRVLFGGLMFASMVRFWANGWIEELYITPKVFFPFIEGVQPPPDVGMYVAFAFLIATALFIMIGLFYRFSASLFFLLFTYVELLDKTNYLNHYYFVSLVSFLLIWLPANGDFSLDVRLGFTKPIRQVAVGFVNMLRVLLGIVYFFAGIAKLNADWLFRAQPMKMWLSANAHQPIIGWAFRFKATAFAFSWLGLLYDTTIPFFLAMTRFRRLAYMAVVAFHLMTWWLFPIGMFPFIMIALTTIYFKPSTHELWLNKLKRLLSWSNAPTQSTHVRMRRPIIYIFAAFLAVQLLLPIRYLAYPGDLFWTEQGYRFSWRVMLMEKAGQATFYVSEKGKPGESMVPNYEYLTPQQEKMMATQPDMLVQYAHILEDIYQDKGMVDPQIRAEVYVTLNGKPSKLFIDPNVDLTEMSNNWGHKEWILEYE